MFLALDLGNSSAKGGLFAPGTPADAAPMHTFTLKRVAAGRLRAALAEPEAVTAAGLCSVVPTTTQQAIAAVEAVCGVAPGVVQATGPLPVSMAYKTPATLGADRVAAAVAAHVLHGWDAAGQPRAVVVVDAGTAVTLEVVDAHGAYLGGAILPGLRLQRAALAGGTAQLPAVPPVAPPSAIGRSTTTALQAGLVLGLIGALDGLIARTARELATEPFVVATGGSASLLAAHLARLDAVAPHLVLQGVRLLTDPTLA